jgi:hypothetical protein
LIAEVNAAMRNAPFTRMALVSLCASISAIGSAAEMRPAAAEGFNQYVQATEKQMDIDIGRGLFLRIDSLSKPQSDKAYLDLRAGHVLIERKTTPKISRAMIHHWMATAFFPGGTVKQSLALLQDYNSYPTIYRPEVMNASLKQRAGDDFKVSLRLRKHKVITVVLDADYDVRFFTVDRTHAFSRSYSTRIAEIESSGEKDEHEVPAGRDHGFLWRLNTYWRLVEMDGGVYVQCEAISLTRDVPAGLGWMIGPFIESIPRESLLFTLNSTREALSHSTPQSANNWR